ncbi:winged helix DNA-binding domain-containing protein [Gaertneriomyces semiglobifer]|nr:winged helix DNA-binding domain-containing protein [Gaertneriomyces semiglobifer]
MKRKAALVGPCTVIARRSKRLASTPNSKEQVKVKDEKELVAEKTSHSTATITTKTVSVRTTTVSSHLTKCHITYAQAQRLRLCNNFLLDSPWTSIDDAPGICDSLCGVQAQETIAGLMSLHRRIGGRRTLDEYKKYLEDSSTSLIRIWAQRGTLHFISTAFWPVVSATLSGWIRNYRETSVQKGNVTGKNDLEQFRECEAWLREVLKSGKSVTRADLEAKGWDGRLAYSVFMCATVDGWGSRADSGIVPAPKYSMSSKREASVHLEEPDVVVENREQKKEEPPIFLKNSSTADVAWLQAAKNYFLSYAPCSEADFRYFFSLKASQSKPIVSHLVSTNLITPVFITDSEGPLPKHAKEKLAQQYIATEHLSRLTDIVRESSRIPTLLLPRFDPYLLSHATKHHVIDPNHKGRIWTANGFIKASVLVNGVVKGGWSVNGDVVKIEMFEEGVATNEIKENIRREAEMWGLFMGIKDAQVEFG